MNFYTPWPCFAILCLLLALAATPLMAAADAPPSERPDRITTIDGLRGFLALAVFFRHAAGYHDYLLTGVWEYPPSSFYGPLGPIGVSVFFMITGYLFWSRLIRTRGRPGWVGLYLGRLFRVGPLYLVAIAIMIAMVFITDGFQLRVSGYQLAREIAKWAALGYFMDYADVNGDRDAWILLAGVTWSIHYEWLFYLSLLVTGFVTRYRRIHLPFAAFMLVLCLIWSGFQAEGRNPVILTALFLIGMTCSSLHETGLIRRFGGVSGSILLLFLLVPLFFMRQTYAVIPVILLGIAFLVIIGGYDAFGLLTSRPARRLGNVSYGIYLLQGLVLAPLFQPLAWRAAVLASPALHWSLTLGAAILLVAVATLAHAMIERPGIALGKRASRGVARILVSRPHLWRLLQSRSP